jgi:ABC-type arginine transport system permease subunit
MFGPIWSIVIRSLDQISSTKLFSTQIFLAAAFKFITIAALIYKIISIVRNKKVRVIENTNFCKTSVQFRRFGLPS